MTLFTNNLPDRVSQTWEMVRQLNKQERRLLAKALLDSVIAPTDDEELDSQNVEVEDITLALANMLTRASESSKKNGGATNEYTLWHALLTEENCLLGQIFDRYQISRTHLLNLFTGRNNVN